MIVEVLIAQRNTVDTLHQQLPGPVFATPGVAVVGEALRQALKQIECLFDFAQDDRAAVGTHATAVETGGDLMVEKAGKFKFRWGTMCGHGLPVVLWFKWLIMLYFTTKGSPFLHYW